jgi:monolysocardiolipin acyltransferase
MGDIRNFINTVHKRFLPELRQRLAVPMVGLTGRMAMRMLAPERRLYNIDRLIQLAYGRRDRPLITVANHTATVDDPLLWSVLLPWWRLLLQTQRFRHVLGAEELMFFNRPAALFFDSGRVIPIIRGLGLEQWGVRRALEVLDDNGWLQIYSEGRVNQSGTLRTPLRWGIGKLVESARTTPLVLPIYHVGFDDVLPLRRPMRFHFGRRLAVMIGEPLDFSELVNDNRNAQKPPRQTYIEVTEAVQNEMLKLENRMKELRAEWG